MLSVCHAPVGWQTLSSAPAYGQENVQRMNEGETMQTIMVDAVCCGATDYACARYLRQPAGFWVVVCCEGSVQLLAARSEKEGVVLAQEALADGHAPVLVMQRLHLFSTNGPLAVSP